MEIIYNLLILLALFYSDEIYLSDGEVEFESHGSLLAYELGGVLTARLVGLIKNECRNQDRQQSEGDEKPGAHAFHRLTPMSFTISCQTSPMLPRRSSARQRPGDHFPHQLRFAASAASAFPEHTGSDRAFFVRADNARTIRHQRHQPRSRHDFLSAYCADILNPRIFP